MTHRKIWPRGAFTAIARATGTTKQFVRNCASGLTGASGPMAIALTAAARLIGIDTLAIDWAMPRASKNPLFMGQQGRTI